MHGTIDRRICAGAAGPRERMSLLLELAAAVTYHATRARLGLQTQKFSPVSVFLIPTKPGIRLEDNVS